MSEQSAFQVRREILSARPRRSRLIAALVIVALAITLLWLGQPGSGILARGWDRLVAEQEDPPSLTNRGSMLERGRGTSQDYGTALRLFRQAADQGYAPAMTDLAAMYEKGEGTPRDYAAAAKWYQEAWDRGGEKWAAYRLAQFYEDGLGVEKNQSVANFWNTLASSPAAMCG
jgi:TPR repeat protein